MQINPIGQQQNTPFFKMVTTEMNFKLKDLAVEEDYKIWDNSTKTFLQRGMILTGTDGIQYPVENTKFMKAIDFTAKFPQKAKKNQYIRHIIIGNEEKRFGFNKTSNDFLNQLIGSVTNMGSSPLAVTYKLQKAGIGLATTYTMSIAPMNQTQAPQVPQFNMSIQQAPLVLTPVETNFLTAYKQQIPQQNWNVEDFVKAGTHNNVGIDARLREIYQRSF
jgi:hypothetical protein